MNLHDELEIIKLRIRIDQIEKDSWISMLLEAMILAILVLILITKQ